MICIECDKEKAIFEVHPLDRNQELKICKECSERLQYEYEEVMTGRAIEREERLCL